MEKTPEESKYVCVCMHIFDLDLDRHPSLNLYMSVCVGDLSNVLKHIQSIFPIYSS